MSLVQSKRLSFEEREKRILAAAGQVFSRWGFRGTTTRAIAQAAGVNEALLFRHFHSKEALYEAYLNHIMTEWTEEVVPKLEKFLHQPLKQALIGISKIIIQGIESDPNLVRTMVFASLEDPSLGPSLFNRRLPLKEFMKKFIEERQKSQEIRLLNSTLLATTYLSSIFYYIHVKEIFSATALFYGPEPDTLEFFCEIFLEGACL